VRENQEQKQLQEMWPHREVLSFQRKTCHACTREAEEYDIENLFIAYYFAKQSSVLVIWCVNNGYWSKSNHTT